jgi:DNA repair photolyase
LETLPREVKLKFRARLLCLLSLGVGMVGRKPGLVVGSTWVTSTLCHSLLRVEPYSSCPFACSYCYARWYGWGPSGTAGGAAGIIAAFERVARLVRRRGLQPIPFRLATLVDPFPPQEAEVKLTLRALAVALEHEYPIVVNTKGVLYAREPWRGALRKLAERGLVLLQVSLSTTSGAVQLEPRAPPPAERLGSAAQLAEEGAPVAVRVSPHIPRLSPTQRDEVEEFVSKLREVGFRHLILEFLRGEPRLFESLAERLRAAELREVEPYSLREAGGAPPIVRVRLPLRVSVALAYAEAAKKAGLTFATCMEGLFELHTAPDCCGVYLLEDAASRPTLGDVYRHVASKRPASPAEVAAACTSWGRVCGSELLEYPRLISKPLRYHERKLWRALGDARLLERLTPNLRLEGGLVVAKRLSESAPG